jgi:hypothetical protein
MRMGRTITPEQALKNAAASVEMEGFHISEEAKELCKQVLNGQIDYAAYLAQVKRRAGVAI